MYIGISKSNRPIVHIRVVPLRSCCSVLTVFRLLSTLVDVGLGLCLPSRLNPENKLLIETLSFGDEEVLELCRDG